MVSRSDGRRSKKWGAYRTEREDFEFARANLNDETKTAEAELMDWADDIAYSVHDLEDFHRSRLLPWRIILREEGRDRLVESALIDAPDRKLQRNLEKAHKRLAGLIIGLVGDLLDQPYEGTSEQRRAIRVITSNLIGRYIDSVHLQVPSKPGVRCVFFDQDAASEILVLKQIARQYIIANPVLQGQQRGQRRILENLFEDIFASKSERFLPRRFEHLPAGVSRSRWAADCIASLTESESMALHARLRGSASGSVLDPIVY